MKKSLIKNTLREIKNSKARFISIMAIIALGCGFYCGIKATAPSMTKMADSYYERTKLMDYRLVSTVGFDDEDVKAVEKASDVTMVEAGYFTDVIADYSNTAHEVRLLGVNDKFNELTVLEGRLPEKEGEIALENGSFAGAVPKIGETVKIRKRAGDNDISKMLKTLEYTVVGQIRSPLYISYERGTTTVGDGSLDTFMYVSKDSFSTERYTELYVKTKYSSGATMNDQYSESIKDFTSKLKSIGKLRYKVFKVENIDKAQKTLDEKRQEYIDGKKKAKDKLASGLAKIKKGEREYKNKIREAEIQIADAEKQIKQGYSDYYSGLAKYKSEIAKSEKKLKDGEKDYKKGLSEYKKGLKEYKAGYKKFKSSYDEFYDETKPDLDDKLKEAKDGLAKVEKELKKVREDLKATNPITALPLKLKEKLLIDNKKQITDGIDQIESGIEKGVSEFSKAEKKLKASKQKLTKGKKQLDNAKSKIANGRKQLAKAKVDNKKKLDDAYSQIKAAEAQVAKGKAELESNRKSGLKELNAAKKKYADSKTKVYKKLDKAKKRLDAAQKKLDSVSKPKWYVFTRDDNPGYSAFSDNTDRIDAVSVVFPVFFLLVAVLVCLTTMTRLVDEKRTEIGTFKALGYSNAAIVGKFLVYSTTAGLVGAGIGIAIGINTLPYIIYNAYKMMYSMDDITIVADSLSIVINIIVAILCTTVVTAITCYKSLKHRPARLMRPKGPKSGKRILLERIEPLWKHFSFTSKVTARNIFRYKSRMFMTVLGVAGCTALIVSAFGLQDSLNIISKVQFEEINTYNAILVAQGDTIKEMKKSVDSEKYVNASASVAFIDSKIRTDSIELEGNSNVCVPKDIEEYKDIVNLRTRVNHTPLELSDTGVIINEKMSRLLSVKEGDKIYVTVDDKERAVTINGICEQYVSHYVYMSPTLYEKLYGKPEYKTLFVDINGDKKVQSKFGNKMLKRDDVAAITFMDTKVDEFNDMLSSMNMVVFIMIFCAGALAFVVLYNLTNINIAERVREIATIKVLGFDNRETSSFIYRENIVLLVLGIILGLLMGTTLCSWIVSTIEMDAVMFGRTVNILSYVWAALLTTVFALVVNFIMFFKMKKIDMVESLKSVE